MAYLSLEPVTWRVRALAGGGRTVADSRAALLVLREDAPPAYAFPLADIDSGAIADAAWRALDGAPGHLVLEPGLIEGILEEDEPLPGHPRNPYHRVDAIASSRHVVAELAGETIETVTTSPYAGHAIWFSARIAGEIHRDVAWTYRFPVAQLPRVAGLLAFRDELVREL